MSRVTEVMNVSRSGHYEQRRIERGSYQKPEDERYRVLIRKAIDIKPSYGYRRITTIVNRMLRAEGRETINHKRVYRLMKRNGYLLQRHTGRPSRSHEGTIVVAKSNQRWCSDIFEIRCDDGQPIRVAFSLDCCDREVMSYVATTAGISSDMIKDMMLDAVMTRFGAADTVSPTIEWLSDNGPAYISRETRAFAKLLGLEVRTTPYRSPESNGMAESFVKTFKRDYVSVYGAPDPQTLLELLPKWFDDYNENHPHGGLKMLSPREFRRQQKTLEMCPV